MVYIYIPEGNKGMDKFFYVKVIYGGMNNY